MSFERRKTRVGKIVRDTTAKTRIVEVEWRSTHRLYKKSMRRRTRFNVHDEANSTRLGDTVRIIETRPLSRTKRWKISEIIQREDIAEVSPDEITSVGDIGIIQPLVETPMRSESPGENPDAPQEEDQPAAEASPDQEQEESPVENPDTPQEEQAK